MDDTTSASTAEETALPSGGGVAAAAVVVESGVFILLWPSPNSVATAAGAVVAASDDEEVTTFSLSGSSLRGVESPENSKELPGRSLNFMLLPLELVTLLSVKAATAAGLLLPNKPVDGVVLETPLLLLLLPNRLRDTLVPSFIVPKPPAATGAVSCGGGVVGFDGASFVFTEVEPNKESLFVTAAVVLSAADDNFVLNENPPSGETTGAPGEEENSLTFC